MLIDSKSNNPPLGQRLAYVDGLRAFAAILVLLFHVGIQVFHIGESERIEPRSGLDLLQIGALGVPIFIVLSGFCLAYPFFRRREASVDWKVFLTKRALRILPPYYIVMFALLVIFTVPSLRAKAGTKIPDSFDISTHVLLFHNLFDRSILKINGPFWSIALECQLYLVFPILYAFSKNIWRLLLTSVPIAVVVYCLTFAFPDLSTSYAYWRSLPAMLPAFIFGMVAAYRHAGRFGIPKWVPYAAMSLLVVGFGLRVWTPSYLIPTLIVAAGTAMVCLGREAVGPLLYLLESKPMVRIGLVSYTLYLIHVPILSLLAKSLSQKIPNPLITSIIAISVTFLATFLLFPLIELPFIKLHSRLWSRKPAQATSENSGASG